MNSHGDVTARLAMGPAKPMPWQLTRGQWAAVFRRAGRRVIADDYGMIASSVAFSAFLALLPLLGLVALTYGMVESADTVIRTVRALVRVVPGDARAFIGDWLIETITRDSGRGSGIVISATIALYSAVRAGRSVIAGLNIAYSVDKPRGFVRQTLVSLAFVLSGAGLVLLAMVSMSVLSLTEAFVPVRLGPSLRMAFWAGAVGVAALALTLIYRRGSARAPIAWRWTITASAMATLFWLLSTLVFGHYLTTFATYDRTYGSIGAVVVLQIWLFLSAMIFLACARINFELEAIASEQDPS